MIFVRIGRRLDRRLEARPSAAKYIPSVNASRSRAGAAERARPMATVPRGGSALARIAGNCLAAMAHTMGCGAVAAGVRLRLRVTVHNRPTRLDGSDADGIGIGGLSVQESTTPSPRKKNTRAVLSAQSLRGASLREASLAKTGRNERVPWMTGFQAQVVHRHARHTAPSRGKPLFWAMAARVCWETRACRRLHCPE